MLVTVNRFYKRLDTVTGISERLVTFTRDSETLFKFTSVKKLFTVPRVSKSYSLLPESLKDIHSYQSF